MAEDSPILDMARKVYTTLDDFGNGKPGKKKDTSWHDKMVKTANQSFTSKPAPKKQAKKRTVKTSAKRYGE